MKPKNILRRILTAVAIVGAALLLTSSNCDAQTTGPKQIGNLAGGTNNITGNSTNTFNALINIPTAGQVDIWLYLKCDAAYTGNAFFNLAPTDSSTNAGTVTAQNYLLTVPCNGTTQVIWHTNLNIGATPSLKLTTGAMTNVAGVNLTNIQGRFVFKSNI